ncbi:hypothetical protein BGV51_28185 [Burkholderia ubonensis]|nr:hypothetical protein WM01_19405 [Burkholderia ubonensis]OJA94442.1 hypothetical protein BGV51_28185 [Burkholderia ubonensis]
MPDSISKHNKDAQQEPALNQVVVRLDAEMLRRLEEQLPKPLVNSTTTDLMAGYALGVQAVLQKLREGYVVSRS